MYGSIVKEKPGITVLRNFLNYIFKKRNEIKILQGVGFGVVVASVVVVVEVVEVVVDVVVVGEVVVELIVDVVGVGTVDVVVGGFGVTISNKMKFSIKSISKRIKISY